MFEPGGHRLGRRLEPGYENPGRLANVLADSLEQQINHQRLWLSSAALSVPIYSLYKGF